MKKYQISKINKDYIIKDAESFFKTVQKLRNKKTKMMMQLGVLFITPICMLIINKLPTQEAIVEVDEFQNTQENIYLAIQEIVEKNYDNYTINFQYEPSEDLLAETEIIDVESEIEQYFIYYCEIYQLDESLVFQKAKELTNDFTDPEWLQNNNIKGTAIAKKERIYSSQELGILAFIRNINQKPNDFGYTNGELKTTQRYETNQTLEEFTIQICTLLDHLDPNICQAIQYHETQYYTSDVFKTKNNCGGLKKQDGSYQSFDNPFQGVIEISILLEYKYLVDKGISNNTTPEEQLSKIQPSYCPIPTLPSEENLTEEALQLYNREKSLNEAWLTQVTAMYHELSSAPVEEKINKK